MGLEVRLEPRSLLFALRELAVEELRVHDDEVDAALVERAERGTEVLVPDRQPLWTHPAGRHRRVRLVTDIHVPGHHLHREPRVLELADGRLAPRIEGRVSRIFLLEVAQMEREQWAEGPRHREGRITAGGPVAHDRRVHRVALRSVHERIDDVVGVGDHHELQGRGRQMIAVELHVPISARVVPSVSTSSRRRPRGSWRR